MKFELGKMILVGDNPFHGISHFSEKRARARGRKIGSVEYASQLVLTSIHNGANGFMFSVSDTTLSILKLVSERVENYNLTFHAIVPYAYEYVRLATHLGTLGLGKKLVKRIIMSFNPKAIVTGIKSIVNMDPEAIMKTYLYYEIARIQSSIKKRHKLTSVLLHEVITDMLIALDLGWLVKSYTLFLKGLGIKPGFETRNFPFLVKKLRALNIDLSGIELVSSFNRVGFQMNPSKAVCEEILAEIPESNVIAMSILAAGYIRLNDAAKYVKNLPNLKGIVVGVSKEKQANETFSYLKQVI